MFCAAFVRACQNEPRHPERCRAILSSEEEDLPLIPNAPRPQLTKALLVRPALLPLSPAFSPPSASAAGPASATAQVGSIKKQSRKRPCSLNSD